MSTYPLRIDTRKSLQEQIIDIHKGLSKALNSITSIESGIKSLQESDARINKLIVQLDAAISEINGHSNVMPDTKGENPDHDRRYQKRIVKPGSEKSGATQVAAGAIAGERWITSSHATLPDNVQMLGA